MVKQNIFTKKKNKIMKKFICDLVYALSFRNLCIGWCNSKLKCDCDCDC